MYQRNVHLLQAVAIMLSWEKTFSAGFSFSFCLSLEVVLMRMV